MLCINLISYICSISESPGATACDNNPCQNDGTCAVSGNSYTCSCPDGYSGDNCQTSMFSVNLPLDLADVA